MSIDQDEYDAINAIGAAQARIRELEAENERLRGEAVTQDNARTLQLRRATDIAARLQAVEGALRPFAKIGDRDGPYVSELTDATVPMEWCIAAALALTPAPATPSARHEYTSPVEREWDNSADDAAWKDL